MDNRYIENVIKEMQPFFDENGFKAQENYTFKNDKKVVSVEYNEARQMYILNSADIAEDGTFELSEASAFLFDDSQNAKDAEAVGIDFVNTLRNELGIKHKRAASSAIDLPTASRDGSYSISDFTKKVLDVFPAFKDDYKAHKSVYGNFLYLNFFGEKLVPQIKIIFNENNKKNVKKFLDIIETGYLKGDRDTVNTIVAVLAAACVGEERVKENMVAAFGENKHLADSVTEFIPVLSANKKLSSALLK